MYGRMWWILLCVTGCKSMIGAVGWLVIGGGWLTSGKSYMEGCGAFYCVGKVWGSLIGAWLVG